MCLMEYHCQSPAGHLHKSIQVHCCPKRINVIYPLTCYILQVHFVHWNCDKYSSYTEASEQSDGLAVLAVFMQVITSLYYEYIDLC